VSKEWGSLQCQFLLNGGHVDILAEALLTALLVDRPGRIILTGVGPDIVFYLTYPLWLVARGEALDALSIRDSDSP
jgi:hypothetical protein